MGGTGAAEDDAQEAPDPGRISLAAPIAGTFVESHPPPRPRHSEEEVAREAEKEDGSRDGPPSEVRKDEKHEEEHRGREAEEGGLERGRHRDLKRARCVGEVVA